LAVVLVVAIAVPAFANGGTTDVTVTAGGGSPPIVKCKWETPDDGDTGSGTQVLPSGTYQVYKEVHFWAVVTDPEGTGTVQTVYADVWHPEGPPLDGSFKYQLKLNLVPDKSSAMAEFEWAYNAGLVTFGYDYINQCDFTYEEVVHELEQCLADFYHGQQKLHYHQPAGSYKVEAYAYDKNNNPSEHLENHFDYVPVTACEFDFQSVDYGSIDVCYNKWVGGNLTFGDGIPTVRNIGNTNLRVQVAQDDMGFGKTEPDWNVEYDARLGAYGVHANYLPYKFKGDPDPDPIPMTTLEDVLELCNTEKLDFSIHVIKADPGQYSGCMVLACEFAPFVSP
jgi:hypothetical protein